MGDILFIPRKKRVDDAGNAHQGQYHLLLKSAKSQSSQEITISPAENTALQLDFYYKSWKNVHNFLVEFKFPESEWMLMEKVAVTPGTDDYFHTTITVPIGININSFRFRFKSTGIKGNDKLYIDDVTLKRISNGSTE